MGGTPPSGTSEQALAVGRAGSWCPPPGEAGGSRARRALPPPPVPPGSPLSHHGGPGGRGGGAAHPTFSKGRACSLPHPPRIKEAEEEKKKRFKPNRGKDLVGFFSPLACHLQGAEAPQAPLAAPPNPHPPAAGPDSSLLTICFSLGKVSGAILWPTHRGYICSKCWVASAGEALIPHHVQFPI